jgi:hypothetical protein
VLVLLLVIDFGSLPAIFDHERDHEHDYEKKSVSVAKMPGAA